MATDLGSPNAVTVRRMAHRDLDAVLENEIRSYAFPWTRGVFADCLQSGYECWVSECDRELLGHGILSVAVAEAHLLNLCVRRDRQGEGHGRALALHLLRRARARGARSIYLEVRPTNRVALALYRSLGFVPVGRRAGYYPAERGHEDAEVLALALEGAPQSSTG
jgi:[ribosomal protein S18]-alanine N-acetyltransferase